MYFLLINNNSIKNQQKEWEKRHVFYTLYKALKSTMH